MTPGSKAQKSFSGLHEKRYTRGLKQNVYCMRGDYKCQFLTKKRKKSSVWIRKTSTYSHRPYHRGLCGPHLLRRPPGRRSGELSASHRLSHPFTPSVVKREKSSFLDRFPDPNTPPAVSAISGRAASMSAMPTDAGAARSSMKATRSTKERKKLEGLPASFGTEEEVETLDLILKRPDPGPQGDPELFHF